MMKRVKKAFSDKESRVSQFALYCAVSELCNLMVFIGTFHILVLFAACCTGNHFSGIHGLLSCNALC